MQEVSEQVQTRNYTPNKTENEYMSVFYDGVYYPEERTTDMGESSIHIKLLASFLNILEVYFKDREDVFFSGNMNVYPEKGNPHNWFAPDLLVAFGIPNVERSSYLLWREGVFPQVIFEIASKKTWQNDVDEKLAKYETLGASEYYILDPEFEFLPEPLTAYERNGEKLVRRNVTDERIFSPLLELEIVRQNSTFRFFSPYTDEFLPTLEEAEQLKNEYKSRAESAENEIEQLKAEIEKLKKRQ